MAKRIAGHTDKDPTVVYEGNILGHADKYALVI